MRKSRLTEAQIVAVVHEVEAGAKIADVTRPHAITETTFDRWRKKYGGLQVSEAKRLRALEEENRRPQRAAGHFVRHQVLRLQRRGCCFPCTQATTSITVADAR